MKNSGNILITSAGKRVSLVKIFKKTIEKQGYDIKVLTTDMKPQFAPAGFISDSCFQVPRATDNNYMDVLLKICRENNVKVLIPTIDTELLILAENKDLFRKNEIFVLVAGLDFISICRDKRKTNVFFEKSGINIPKILDKNNPIFPMFAKPYDGSLSKDIYLITGKEELTTEIMNNPKLIFMEYIDKTDYKEFTVDMYYGKDNLVKSIVPRERLEIRAGEINKGYTRKNYLVHFLRERMNHLHGVVGCICIQLFYNEQNNNALGIEINPRFGGGYPLSYHALADFPLFIIQEYFENKAIDYSDNWFDNTLMLRYDDEIIVYEKEENNCF
jgi:carbamoyl-phosphate synthase large subunit